MQQKQWNLGLKKVGLIILTTNQPNRPADNGGAFFAPKPKINVVKNNGKRRPKNYAVFNNAIKSDIKKMALLKRT